MTDALPTLHTVDDLRQYLGLKSDRHIQRNLASWPHITIAREVRFLDEHVTAILAMHERGTGKADAPAFSGQRTRGGAS